MFTQSIWRSFIVQMAIAINNDRRRFKPLVWAFLHALKRRGFQPYRLPLGGKNKVIKSGDWDARFRSWFAIGEIAERYQNLNPTISEILFEMDRQFKLNTVSTDKKMFISSKNSWGDIENAKLMTKRRSLICFVAANDSAFFYPKDVGENPAS